MFNTFLTPLPDVRDIKFVINYDMPSNVADYVHRIGRTARGKDASGTAYTFFTADNAKQARALVELMKRNKQEIPGPLEDMARYSRGGGGKFFYCLCNVWE